MSVRNFIEFEMRIWALFQPPLLKKTISVDISVNISDNSTNKVSY